MSENLFAQITPLINVASENYHRLLIVVSPSGTGKTKTFQEVHKQIGAPICNVNLELSLQMLELTEKQRTFQLPKILGDVIQHFQNEVVLMDNIEVLFDDSLKQDPLRLLQNLSRNKTLVVAWNGLIEDNSISYAIPGHPEHKRYPIRDFLAIGKTKDILKNNS
jgi:hypothetical protein